jgi:hypothetical protein
MFEGVELAFNMLEEGSMRYRGVFVALNVLPLPKLNPIDRLTVGVILLTVCAYFVFHLRFPYPGLLIAAASSVLSDA